MTDIDLLFWTRAATEVSSIAAAIDLGSERSDKEADQVFACLSQVRSKACGLTLTIAATPERCPTRHFLMELLKLPRPATTGTSLSPSCSVSVCQRVPAPTTRLIPDPRSRTVLGPDGLLPRCVLSTVLSLKVPALTALVIACRSIWSRRRWITTSCKDRCRRVASLHPSTFDTSGTTLPMP
jgi:hypothetical protein